MKYRLNYGQGNVSGNQTLSLCNEWAKKWGGSYVEKQDEDTFEWFPCSHKGAFLDMTDRANSSHPVYGQPFLTLPCT